MLTIAAQLPLVRLTPMPADLSGSLGSLSGETLLVLALYGAIAAAYLVVIPLLLIAWMHRRWMVMGKLERTGVYGLVFLFFPGLILFSPFINLRMAGQGEARP
jgi:NAD(P)H-quinone oxidoreductase subunit L